MFWVIKLNRHLTSLYLRMIENAINGVDRAGGQPNFVAQFHPLGRIEREETLAHGLGRIRDVRQGPEGYIYLAIESRGAPGRIVRLEPVDRH